MRKPQTERVKEAMPEKHKKKTIERAKRIIEHYEKLRDKYGECMPQHTQYNEKIKFLKKIRDNQEEAKKLIILCSLYPDIEERELTTTEELRKVIVKNRPNFLKKLKLNFTSNINILLNILKDLKNDGMLDDGGSSYNSSITDIGVSSGKEKTAYSINEDKVKEYFGISFDYIITEMVRGETFGLLDLCEDIFSKEVSEKFGKEEPIKRRRTRNKGNKIIMTIKRDISLKEKYTMIDFSFVQKRLYKSLLNQVGRFVIEENKTEDKALINEKFRTPELALKDKEKLDYFLNSKSGELYKKEQYKFLGDRRAKIIHKIIQKNNTQISGEVTTKDIFKSWGISICYEIK